MVYFKVNKRSEKYLQSLSENERDELMNRILYQITDIDDLFMMMAGAKYNIIRDRRDLDLIGNKLEELGEDGWIRFVNTILKMDQIAMRLKAEGKPYTNGAIINESGIIDEIIGEIIDRKKG